MKKLFMFFVFLVALNYAVVANTNLSVSNLSVRNGSDTLKYDDGNGTKLLSGYAYWAVKYEVSPELPFSVTSALFYLDSTNAETCMVSVCPDSNGKPGPASEVDTFIAATGWQTVDFDSSHFYNGDFWLTFVIAATNNGPFVVGDNSGSGHSYYSNNGSYWIKKTDTDYLIRAVGDFIHYDHDVKTLSVKTKGYVDPFSVLTPEATVMNIGTNTENFDVVCKIGSGYTSIKSFTNISPDSIFTVQFDTLTPDSGSVLDVTVYTSLTGDQVPQNDTMKSQIIVQYYPRTVLLEIFTGTWCPSCPPAAQAADQLKNEVGDSLSVIEYHLSDNYTFSGCNVRDSYYGIQYVPTAEFDGIIEEIGGSSSTYSIYRNYFNQRKILPKYFNIDMNALYRINQGTGYVVADISPIDTMPQGNLKLRYAITETGIEQAWQSEDSLFWVAREMLPDANGKALTGAISDTESFTIDGTWNVDNCYLTLFIQDDNSKEVYQTKIIKIADYAGVSQNITMENRCSENSKITVDYINNILFINNRSYNNRHMSIYNITGSKLADEHLLNGMNEVTLKDIIKRNGVYFVRITDNKGILRGLKKFVVLK
ncbi:T9SS type A sorting domain-containing protein [candidate division WOR-3 bacterium]|nr:T9SS type A sorting domain-containing protein [candidate division WOR-3 bacterium]